MTWWDRLMQALGSTQQRESGPDDPAVQEQNNTPDLETRLFLAEQALDYYDQELQRLRAERRWERRVYQGRPPE